MRRRSTIEVKRREHGLYFIFTALSFIVMLALGALGVDVALLIYERLLLQKAANAAVLAGMGLRIETGAGALAGDVQTKALQRPLSKT